MPLSLQPLCSTIRTAQIAFVHVFGWLEVERRLLSCAKIMFGVVVGQDQARQASCYESDFDRRAISRWACRSIQCFDRLDGGAKNHHVITMHRS